MVPARLGRVRHDPREPSHVRAGKRRRQCRRAKEQLLASLRADGVRTPILFLTTMSGIDDRVEGLEGGKAATLLHLNLCIKCRRVGQELQCAAFEISCSIRLFLVQLIRSRSHLFDGLPEIVGDFLDLFVIGQLARFQTAHARAPVLELAQVDVDRVDAAIEALQ